MRSPRSSGPIDCWRSTSPSVPAPRRSGRGVRRRRRARALGRRWPSSTSATRPRSSLEGELREKVRQVVGAVGRSGNGDALDDAAKNTYEELKGHSIQALDESLGALREAEGMLTKDDCGVPAGVPPRGRRRWASGWRRTSRSGRRRTSVRPTPATATARELRSLEDGLYDDLADLDGLVTDKPWREAMVRAMAAKRVAAPSDRLTEQPWYRDLIRRSEAHGQEFVTEGPVARRPDGLCRPQRSGGDQHSLQGHGQVRARATCACCGCTAVRSRRPSGATSRPFDPEPTWQELVEGIDAAMAEKAISQLDSYYVTAVDYAKLARGALSAVKVLAETPQVAADVPRSGRCGQAPGLPGRGRRPAARH